MASIDHVLEVFEWCGLQREAVEPERWFADGFVFDNGVEVHDRESFVRRRNGSAGTKNIKVLHSLAGADTVAMLFQADDGVSRLEVRIAWWVEFAGDLISKITSVHSFSSWPPHPHQD